LTRLPRLSGKQLSKVIKKFGFVYSHTTGSHGVYDHSDGRRTVVPQHAGKEIGPGLLNKIIKKDLKITRKEFLDKIKL